MSRISNLGLTFAMLTVGITPWLVSSPARAADDDFTEVKVVVNVLKGAAATEAQIDDGIAEANKILKQAKIKLTKAKTNRDVSDGGNDDGKCTAAERKKLRESGQKELDTAVGKGKGYKLTIANDSDTADAGTLALTVHETPVTVAEREAAAKDFGNTIAHEFAHAFTLGAGHDVDAPGDKAADGGGHIGGDDKLMHATKKGTKLSTEEIKEIKRTAEKRGETKKKADAPAAPKTKEHKKAAVVDPESGAGDPPGLPPHNDLRECDFFVTPHEPQASGSIELQGMFNRSSVVQSSFDVFLDTDAAILTGRPEVVDGQSLGVEFEINIQIVGDGINPLQATGRVRDIISGNIYSLSFLEVEIENEHQDQLFAGGVPKTVPLLDRVRYEFDRTLLPVLASPTPMGVRARDSLTVTIDEALMQAVETPPSPAENLRLDRFAVTPSSLVTVRGERFPPLQLVQIFLDDTLLGSTSADGSGQVAFTFAAPSEVGTFYFVLAVAANGASDFTILHVLGTLPTVSEWGLVTLIVLLIFTGAVMIYRRSSMVGP